MVTIGGLDDSSSSKQVRKYMEENLVVTRGRDGREELYPSWCKTLEDEISIYSTSADSPARVVLYEN